MKWLAFLCLLLTAFGRSVCASDEVTFDVTLRISADAVAIAADELEAEAFRDVGTRGGGIIVSCKRMALTRDANTYVVECDEAVFITAAGVEGTAKQARFDLKSKRVLLTGDEESPVHLIMDAASDDDATHMYAVQIEFKLTPQKKPEQQSKFNKQSHTLEPSPPRFESVNLFPPPPDRKR
jgi:hypothetical protein